ncbi:MAG: hypothetical protein AAF414_13950 [Pseudomonadota bacterium]
MSVRNLSIVCLVSTLMSLSVFHQSALAAGDSEDGQVERDTVACAAEGGIVSFDGDISSCCFSDGCYICDAIGNNCEFDAPYGGPYVETEFDFGAIFGTRPSGTVSSHQTTGTFQTILPTR